MPPETYSSNNTAQSVLGRIAPQDFIGREETLNALVSLSTRDETAHGILLLAAPSSGASELLRQAYDRLFHSFENGVAPVYFDWSAADGNSEMAARRFLYTFLLQTTAYLQRKPALVYAQPTLGELVEMIPVSDDQWVGALIEKYERARRESDEDALVRLCLSAPIEAAAKGRRTVVLFDNAHLIEELPGKLALSRELLQILSRSETGFVLSGLRRRLRDAISYEEAHIVNLSTLLLVNLNESEARSLTVRLSAQLSVELNDAARELLVHQFSGNPLFITSVMQAAQRSSRMLTSFLSCQKTYVDELMGGRIKHYYDSQLARVAPSHAMRRTLVRLLYESAMGAEGKASIDSWQKRLDLSPDALQNLIRALHGLEIVSHVGESIKVSDELVWRDYLRAQYRIGVAGEARARVVVEALLDALKRAPQTLDRHYRRKSALALRPLLDRFDWQRVPASLLHYGKFTQAYRGRQAGEIASGLAGETELVRLPQIVYTASAASYYPSPDFICEEEQCVVAHGFDGDFYTDSSEVVWLAVEMDGQKEAGRGAVEWWHERLVNLARRSGFGRVRLWLIATGGFTPDAMKFLSEKDIYASNRHQIELLTSHLEGEAASVVLTETASDEFEIVIPMGGDSELIAANAAEMIARRINFQPEAINQIKTALIEACINAEEHSFSPDRKIYQRFRLESDKLVITVSSRGVRLPASLPKDVRGSQDREDNASNNGLRGRRGWGLKLIRSLMDEVEFERVDEGTRLRMTKFLRPPE
ncbi:MAG: ATP-binding protein [Pyrinomonadaceae bacterium]|nr:ATP-binding protein [Pyrinomonadaceae bacterium]